MTRICQKSLQGASTTSRRRAEMRRRSRLGCNAGARRGSAGVRISNAERSLPCRITLRREASFAYRVDADPLAPLLDLLLLREADLLGDTTGGKVARVYEGDQARVSERVEAVISYRPGRLCRKTSAPELSQEEIADLDLVFAFYLLHGEAALSHELARVFEDCYPETEAVISIALVRPAHPLLRLLAALGVRVIAHRHRVGEDAHKVVDVAHLHLAEHHPLRLENSIRYRVHRSAGARGSRNPWRPAKSACRTTTAAAASHLCGHSRRGRWSRRPSAAGRNACSRRRGVPPRSRHWSWAEPCRA